jgi:starch synthase (maltosyl-transferring)
VRTDDGRRRVVVTNLYPEIEAGRFPIKRVVGESVAVEADAFTDGHDAITVVLLWRRGGDEAWGEVAMEPFGDDRWRGRFAVAELGRYCYTVQAWVDHFKTWRRDLQKRVAAGQRVGVDLKIGAGLIQQAADRADGPDAARLRHLAAEVATNVDRALDQEVASLVGRYPDRRFATTYPRELAVVVDPVLARFSTWYELFPRSAASEPGRHGTLKDVEARLPYVAEMGFDVLYLPPIHPIGITHRKGKNNAVAAEPGDVGSPWAIGGPEGGHKAIHPALGTLDDFERLVDRARAMGIELAMDFALQCSPDHPYVREHPEWFKHRPDGTVQYAENPPKKYQDIFPLDFESPAWRELWEELKSVVLFWIEQGVRVFRVDNPHTKPFPFWEWLIGEVKREHPEAIFLSEAFTRPKVMHRLAKLGFTQSYTYFAWRNSRHDLAEYVEVLTLTAAREYFRPNFWPNTPDILTEYLQVSGRPGFMTRLILAATLAASYGIYGPAFELIEARPREPGSEEYLDSEKYQLRHWELDRPDSLRELIARLNKIRREHPALQTNAGLRIHPTTNDHLLCYSKRDPDGDDVVLAIVNTDPHHRHSGWIELDLEALGVEPGESFQAHDLLTNARFLWQGARNYVELDPHVVPGHVFGIRRRVRREQDFEYFL